MISLSGRPIESNMARRQLRDELIRFVSSSVIGPSDFRFRMGSYAAVPDGLVEDIFRTLQVTWVCRELVAFLFSPCSIQVGLIHYVVWPREGIYVIGNSGHLGHL